MRKISSWIKIISLILAGAVLGAAIFSFVAAKTLWFPETKKIMYENKAGLWVNVYEYSPWLWNKEKITKFVFSDMKNDAPDFVAKIAGEVANITYVHSGEDLAVIRFSQEEDSYWKDCAYLIHRSPKAEGENTMEIVKIEGTMLAVNPDEKSYFSYFTNQNNGNQEIIEKDWQGNELMHVYGQPNYEFDTPIFFDNNGKMAIPVFKRGDYRKDDESIIFIWDLATNKVTEKSLTKLFPSYTGGQLSVQDEKLYIEKADTNIKKILVAE